jgi:hypothetical protein
MKWPTPQEIKERANKSHYEACKVSLESWKQRTTCGAKELRDALKDKKVAFVEEYCGLCSRFQFNYEVNCPLKPRKTCEVECCREYYKASGASARWKKRKGTYKDFVKAAQPLIKRLKKAVKDAEKELNK